MRRKASPVPPHSPPIRSSSRATGAEIASQYQNLAKSRSKGREQTVTSNLPAKGTMQPSPQDLRNTLRTASETAQSRATTRKPVAPSKGTRTEDKGMFVRSGRALRISGRSDSQARTRRGFYR
jgi:hypothetical protein